MESILTSVKKLLGIEKDYTAFDTDIIIGINTAFNTLTQLGVGPTNGFRIYGVREKWSDFIGNNSNLESIKTYVFLKTKMSFDPPQSSAVMECYKEQIKELEWRINLQVDPADVFD